MFSLTTNKPKIRPAPKLRAGYVARNFTRAELACRCCGEYYHWPVFIERLQRLRDIARAPLHITSAHRCDYHNAIVGGVPLSQHIKLAVDVALFNHDRFELSRWAVEAGFTGFGFYTDFIHLDLAEPRKWWGSEKARRAWKLAEGK